MIKIEIVEEQIVAHPVTVNAGPRIGLVQTQRVTIDGAVTFQTVRFWHNANGSLHHMEHPPQRLTTPRAIWEFLFDSKPFAGYTF
jgi:hypothetical protein